jgi:hypothetical protein
MPSKKTKKKQTKSSKLAAKRLKKTVRKKQAKAPRKAVKKKQSSKMRPSKPAASRKAKKPIRTARRPEFTGGGAVVSGRQAGDLDGLSRAEHADSESVDELVEEGNIVEAGAVAGVEEAADQDTREVHIHEVPEDDVPEEYLDKD